VIGQSGSVRRPMITAQGWRFERDVKGLCSARGSPLTRVARETNGLIQARRRDVTEATTCQRHYAPFSGRANELGGGHSRPARRLRGLTEAVGGLNMVELGPAGSDPRGFERTGADGGEESPACRQGGLDGVEWKIAGPGAGGTAARRLPYPQWK